MYNTKENQESTLEKSRFWSSKKGKLTIGGLLSAVLAAVAGFMSPEVRTFTCLDLPKPEDLIYPDVENGVNYRELASQALQPSFHGKNIRFRVRAYSEFDRTPFQSLLSRKFDGYSIASIASAEDKPPAENIGGEFPEFTVLLSPDVAKQWSNFPKGSNIEIEGNAEFIDDFPSDSSVGQTKFALKKRGQDMSHLVVPPYADFIVVADRVTPLKPLNAPQDRLMCKWRKLDS